MSEWEIMVCFCFCFCFCFIIVIWRNFLFVDRTRFFFFLCFVLHARACLTLELPRPLAVCYLMLSLGPELVLSVYKNVYKPTHFSRNSMDSI